MPQKREGTPRAAGRAHNPGREAQVGAPLPLEVITSPCLILLQFLKLGSESTPLEQMPVTFPPQTEKHEGSKGIPRNSVGPYTRVTSRLAILRSDSKLPRGSLETQQEYLGICIQTEHGGGKLHQRFIRMWEVIHLLPFPLLPTCFSWAEASKLKTKDNY